MKLARVCYYYAKGAIADEKNSEKNKSRLVTLFYVNLFLGSKLNLRWNGRIFLSRFSSKERKKSKKKKNRRKSRPLTPHSSRRLDLQADTSLIVREHVGT